MKWHSVKRDCLWVHSFYHIWEKNEAIIPWKFFCLHLSFFSFWNSNELHCLDCFLLSNRSTQLFYFFYFFFSSFWILSVAISSSWPFLLQYLIKFAVDLIQYNFISDIFFFVSKIYIWNLPFLLKFMFCLMFWVSMVCHLPTFILFHVFVASFTNWLSICIFLLLFLPNSSFVCWALRILFAGVTFFLTVCFVLACS